VGFSLEQLSEVIADIPARPLTSTRRPQTAPSVVTIPYERTIPVIPPFVAPKTRPQSAQPKKHHHPVVLTHDRKSLPLSIHTMVHPPLPHKAYITKKPPSRPVSASRGSRIEPMVRKTVTTPQILMQLFPDSRTTYSDVGLAVKFESEAKREEEAVERRFQHYQKTYGITKVPTSTRWRY